MPNFHEMPFVYSGLDADRSALHLNKSNPRPFTGAETRFVPVRGKYNLLLADGKTPLILDSVQARPLLADALCKVVLGNYQNRLHVAIGLPEDGGLPTGDFKLTDLRPQFGILDHGTLALLGYARTMVHWHLHNRYCGKCAAPLRSHNSGHELHCDGCGHILYPRVNPAIIVLVNHEDCCLLARKPGFNRYSTLAGFVEPGESLEAGVHREVQEETNIRVNGMQYRASQPWPFPDSLMLGFHAYAENTDIRCNDGELAEARWFTRADISHGLKTGSLALSTPQSIAYALLRDWFDMDGWKLDSLNTKSAPTQKL